MEAAGDRLQRRRLHGHIGPELLWIRRDRLKFDAVDELDSFRSVSQLAGIT
jgi:hypothetical protein